MMTPDESKPWKKKILFDLQERDKRQCSPFAELILSHARLLECSEGYKVLNHRLNLEVEKLRSENEELKQRGDLGGSSSSNGATVRSDKLQQIEQKLYKTQEELMELHRKKGENAQMIIDLNNAVQERDKQLAARDHRIKELESKLSEMSAKCQKLEQNVSELMSTNQLLVDEQQALQMAFSSLEGSLRRLQDDNSELITRWMALKAKQADSINEENEQFLKEKRKREAEALQQAVAEVGAGVSIGFPPRLSTGDMPGFVLSVPSRALQTIEAHEGDVFAVKWSASGQFFASGGSDRKLKVWEMHGVKCDPKCVLIGCNATVTSIDIDLEDKLILAASNDFASRIWTWNDQRLRHTLTGHSGKVLAAKFLGDSNRIISGSHDRTIKLWDTRTSACTKTIFAGSSCNDLVVFNSTNIISGHFDKSVRFYDLRSDSTAVKEISLEGRITSLDMTCDKTRLLGCTRENNIAVIDLKSNTIITTLSADGFHVAVDHTRAVFSPDGEYIAAGSSNGGVYIWEVSKFALHSVLREHQEAVMACAWNPNGRSLLSCDKHKTVIFWSD